MVYITTYANKSHGLFEELVNNDYGVQVEVLGWGTEWKGFTDKFRGMLKYLDTRNDDDIVVFVDGFDSKINKSTKELETQFKKLDCKVLLSLDPLYISRLVFGTCKNNVVANSGMYMGYAKELKEVIGSAMSLKCNDDQVNMNTVCKDYDFILVDEDEIIFKNISPLNKNVDTDAFFVSFPGSVNFTRYLRGIQEYTQYFYIHILSIIILGMILFPSKTHILLPILLGFSSFYTLFAEKSCTLD